MAHTGTHYGARASALALLALALVSGCGGKKESASAPAPKTVTIALASAWDNLNSLTSSASDYKLYLLNLMFDKLAAIRDDSAITPKLLSSWAFSDDGRTVTAVIHEKAAWHDGKPVTADDVVFTASLFANPLVTTNRRFIHLAGTDAAGVRVEGEEFGARAVDDKTVEFRLKYPVREIVFFSDAQIYFALPLHILGDADPATLLDHPFWQAPVGSGPFVFVSQIIGTEGRFRKNSAYHWGAPDIDELIVRITPNDKLLPAMISGEVDITGGTATSALPHTDFELAKKQPNLVTLENPYLGVQFMIVNTKHPALSDARVRRAVEHAINKQRFVDDLFAGSAQAVYSAISSHNEYYNQNLRYAEYNPQKAAALLDEAGYDRNTTLRLLVPIGNAEREKSAVLIQQDLAAVGVKVNLEMLEFAAMRPAMLAETGNDFAFALYGDACTANPSSFKGYYGRFDYARLRDTMLWDKYSEAERTLDDGAAKALYNEIQQLNEDIVPFILLYSPNQLLAYNKRLSGVDFGSHFIIDNVHEWKVAR